MTLLIPTRRGFLGGLLAAPAIVKISSIMPVKVLPPELTVFNPAELEASQGILSISQITREFLRLLRANLSSGEDPVNASSGVIETKPQPDGIYRLPSDIFKTHRQLHIDMSLSTTDRALPLHTYSERILKPAAYAMANEIRNTGYTRLYNNNVEFKPLEVPKGSIMEAASAETDGICGRGLTDYWIDEDRMITRFDVLFESKGRKASKRPVERLAGPKGHLP